MVSGSANIVGISRWRELRTAKRKIRRKGVWDSNFQRETLILRDGRRLTYFLDGPKHHGQNDLQQQEQHHHQDLPYIFVLHAMFLSGNSFIMKESPKDYILVCINRPGYFGSDEAPENYNHASFASDIEQLADHLQVKQIYVVGHSSGGPCALACAAHLPHRVIAVGLLSSDPEYAHPTSPKKKWMSAFCIGTCLPFLLESLFCCLPLARHSSRGLRNDYKMDTSPYLYEVETAIRQPVLIYVGENDSILPVAVSRHIQTRLMNAYLEVIPKVGHLGLLRDHVLQDFFHTLLSLPRASVLPGGGWEATSIVSAESSIAESNEYTDFHYRINNNEQGLTVEMTKITHPVKTLQRRNTI